MLFCRLFPEIKWAQRKDRLFVTIELADFENQRIDLTPEGNLKFQ
jgi:cytosolic prostaglandin-E synthase